MRCDATIWFRDEEVFSVKNEQMMVTGSWVQLGVINLHDELTEEERKASNNGILILPGEEEHGSDECVGQCSYMRLSLNFMEVEEEEEEVVTGVIVHIPRRIVTFIKWGMWTAFSFALRHALDDQAGTDIRALGW